MAPSLDPAIERLHQLTVYSRWILVGCLWLSVGSLSLWGLRSEIALWQDYFTWTALRYGLAYNLLPAIGLGFCLGTTTGVLVWQSRNILLGLSQLERQRLEQQVQQIHKQGTSHPLWHWVFKDLNG